MADLSLVGVSKRFGAIQAVDGLTLAMASGEFVVLLGPSGAGKTTTLRLVAGLEQADRGSVHIGGARRDARGPGAARRRLRVPAVLALPAPLGVRQPRVSAALAAAAGARRRRARKVEEVARLLRIEDKLQSPATRLSGGQMQRVAIGRALVREPALYLMDEPLSSLDAKLRNDLRLELKRIQQDLGATMLYVTHDQMEALTMATRIGVLEQGRLVQVGTPQDVYEDPASTYVAARLGLAAHQPDLARARSRRRRARADGDGRRARRAPAPALARRPRARGPAARVRRIERLGDRQLIHVQLAGTEQELVTAAPGGADFEPGAAVQLELLRPLWFDAAGQRIAA